MSTSLDRMTAQIELARLLRVSHLDIMHRGKTADVEGAHLPAGALNHLAILVLNAKVELNGSLHAKNWGQGANRAKTLGDKMREVNKQVGLHASVEVTNAVNWFMPVMNNFEWLAQN